MNKKAKKIILVKIVKEYDIKEWDAICKRCGKCCVRFGVKDGKLKILGNCEHKIFRKKKYYCEFYPKMFNEKINSNPDNYCVPVEYIQYLKHFNRKCPYIPLLEGNNVIRIYDNDTMSFNYDHKLL